jgi:hypothetical protein
MGVDPNREGVSGSLLPLTTYWKVSSGSSAASGWTRQCVSSGAAASTSGPASPDRIRSSILGRNPASSMSLAKVM